MCLAKVYACRSGEDAVLLKDHVANIYPKCGQVKLVDLFGNTEVVLGVLRQLDLEHSAAYLDLDAQNAAGRTEEGP